MNPIDLLADDHQQFRHLFERLLRPDTASPARMNLFADLKRALELHAAAEHDHFFPALGPNDASRSSVTRAEAGLAQIDGLLAELDTIPVESAAWAARLGPLHEAVQAHIELEESDLFQRARHHLSASSRTHVAEAMHDQRERLTGLRGSVGDLFPPHRPSA